MWKKSSKGRNNLGIKIDIERPIKNSEIFSKLIPFLRSKWFTTLETSYDVVSFYKIQSGVLGILWPRTSKIIGRRQHTTK